MPDNNNYKPLIFEKDNDSDDIPPLEPSIFVYPNPFN
jgi:hypothetical protein